ncbi:MAG: hypothetical protein R3E82_11630 [Pseudomonadales bacterium]
MPICECDNCGGELHWRWEEAFEKFGFMDGDGQVETWQVESVLIDAGCEVVVEGWGLHNTVIISIKQAGKEFIPHDDPNVTFGYDDPRSYLPADIVALLDRELPAP